MTTSAVGSIAYCNPIGYAISFTCTGPNCSFLDGIPVATCTEDAGTITCTSGVTCPSDAPAANFSIEQIGTAITLESILDMGDCGSFKINSDGRSAGTTYVTLNSTNENCPVPGASISSILSSSAVPYFTSVLASESLESSVYSSQSSKTSSSAQSSLSWSNSTSSAASKSQTPSHPSSNPSFSSKSTAKGLTWSGHAVATTAHLLPSTTCLTAVNGDKKSLCACSQIPSAYTPCEHWSSDLAVPTYVCPKATSCGIFTTPATSEPTQSRPPALNAPQPPAGGNPSKPAHPAAASSSSGVVQVSSGTTHSPFGVLFDAVAILLALAPNSGANAFALAVDPHSSPQNGTTAGAGREFSKSLETRQSLQVKIFKELADALGSWAAGQLEPEDPIEPKCPRDFASELSSAVCDYVAGKITGEVDVLGLAQVAALTEVCVAAVYAGLFVGTSGVGLFAGTFVASVLCNAMVSELFPVQTKVNELASKGLCTAAEQALRGCSDLSSSNENCGCCGNKCPAGSSCKNSACTSDTCQGSTCGGFSACGPGGSCVCVSATEGSGFCADGQTLCSGLGDCGSSLDCAAGFVCAFQTCCQRNVCISATLCGGGSVLSKRWMNDSDPGGDGGFTGVALWQH